MTTQKHDEEIKIEPSPARCQHLANDWCHKGYSSTADCATCLVEKVVTARDAVGKLTEQIMSARHAKHQQAHSG